MKELSQSASAIKERKRQSRLRGELPPLPLTKCGVCEKEFAPHINKHGVSRYCPECRDKHGKKRVFEILNGNDHQTCAHCGLGFSGRKRKYCSKSCKDAARVRDPVKDRERQRIWYRDGGGKEWMARYGMKPEVKQKKALQTRLYKARNPEKISEWDNSYRKRRNERIAKSADGTAGRAIAQLMKLKHCQYCGHRFASDAEKRIDHRDPVADGGQHSAANLELCCDTCNSKKAAMPFVQWVSLLPEPHRSRAVARAEKAKGAPLSQYAIPLFGGAVVRRKKDRGIDPAQAKREALAAWDKWLHEMASDEWLDGYYASHPKPWLDHRLTKAKQFYLHYKADQSFARRWNDRRNARRRQQREQTKKINTINNLGSLV